MSEKSSPTAIPTEVVVRLDQFTGRAWALDNVAAWLAGSKRVLLVVAEPGVGKSALAARLVQTDRGEIPSEYGPGWLAAAHFCQQRRQETLAAVPILKRIAAQLAESVPGYAQALAEIHHPEITLEMDVRQRVGTLTNSTLTGIHLHLGELEPRQAFDQVLRAPLKRLHDSGSLPEAVVLLIDALDETVEGAHGLTWAWLLASEIGQDPPPGLRLVATTRPGLAADIMSRLVGAHVQVLDLLGDQPAEVDDVADYALHRLRDIRAPGGRTLARRIAEAGEGNFLYARYVIDDVLTRRPVSDDLATLPLPHGLAGVYQGFLDRAIAVDPHAWQHRFRPVLAALVEGQGEGLTRDQLTLITGLRERDVDDALRVCAPYLRVTPRGMIRPYHQSLRDFLRQPGDLHIYPRDTNIDIADRLTQVCQGRWMDCPYLLENLATHVAAACPLTCDAPPAVHQAAAVLTDPAFIYARAATAGIDGLLTDAARILEALPNPSPELVAVYRAARRQSHHLRGWNPREQPGFLLQQLLYETVVGGNRTLARAMARYLDQEQFPHLQTLWATRGSAQLVHTLSGHTAPVGAVAVTPDGSRVITGSDDGTARVWDPTTGRELHTLSGHTAPVDAVAVTSDGSRAITDSEDGTTRAWDLMAGQEFRTLTGHMAPPEAMALAVDGSRAMALAPDGSRAITGSEDGTAHVWDLTTGRELHTLTGHTGPVQAVAITPGGTYAITGSQGDRTARVWDLTTGQETHALTGDHTTPLHAVGLTPDGTHAITSSHSNDDAYTGIARVWDLTTGQETHTLTGGHPVAVQVVGLTPDGTHAITGGGDGTVCVWDLTGSQEPYALTGHTSMVRAMGLTPDGTRAITSSQDASPRVWDLATSREGQVATSYTRPVLTVAMIPNSTRAIVVPLGDTAAIWDLNSGQELCRAISDHGWVGAVAGTPDGIHGIAAFGDTPVMWDLDSGQEQQFTGHTDIVLSMAVTSDGTCAITGSQDETARVWDLATGRELHTLSGHAASVRAVAVVPDGTCVITASDDGTTRVWNLTTGQERHILVGHAASVHTVAVTPDGTCVITGSEDGTARVWDLATGRELHTLSGHAASVHTVAVTPDGTCVITASDDGTTRLWNLTTGQQVMCFAAPHDSLCLAVTLDDPPKMVCGSGGDMFYLEVRP
ncbi:AAA family ATPase [Streptomyces avermitilis]|uniref:AAA family ATPase n=1 Tax=Streptomyces avermitilis TaxID=33903 RepID=UPI0036B819A2